MVKPIFSLTFWFNAIRSFGIPGGVLLILLLVLNCCKSKTDLIYPPTRLSVVVKDTNGVVLNGARVSLFDDETEFLNARAQNSVVAAVQSVISANGAAYFEGLDFEKNYWVYVTYRDNVNNLEYSNANTNFKLENKLSQGSITYAEIVVKGTNTYISFWTKPSANTLPIQITLDNDTFLLGQSSPTAPLSVTDPNGRSINKIPGTYSIYAKLNSGCIWAGEVVLQEGGFKPVEIGSCEVGTIGFYTTNDNASHYPITVNLDNGDLVGTLNQDRSIAPAGCNDLSNTVSVQRAFGNYRYQARSADGKCLWAGNLSITSENCQFIILDACD